MEIMCEIYPKEKAIVEVTYGLYSEYEKGRPYWNHKLCNKAADELWQKCSHLVSQGFMYWSNKQIIQ